MNGAKGHKKSSGDTLGYQPEPIKMDNSTNSIPGITPRGDSQAVAMVSPLAADTAENGEYRAESAPVCLRCVRWNGTACAMGGTLTDPTAPQLDCLWFARKSQPGAAAGKPAHDREESAALAEPPAPVSFIAFEDYAAAGFHFVRIPRVGGKPTKGPRGYGWNLPQTPANPNGYTADVAQAHAWIRAGDNLGLALVPSGVVSFDIDDLDDTRCVLAGLGLDLDAWLDDPHRVEIRSGKPGKAKLLFRAGAGAIQPSKKLTFGQGRKQRSIFELRHGSTEGQTLQDLLPPSVHPDTGQPYQLVGDVRHLPALPPELRALWQAWPDVLKTFDPAHEPPKAKPLPKSAIPSLKGERNAVEEFNAAHALETLLESHGYRRKGRRYLRPGSESGIPGLTLLDGANGRKLCYSHGGDDLNDGHAHDAFDVYRLLACGGDWKKALAWNSELTEHNRRLFTERKREERQTKAKAALELYSLYVIDAGRICKSDGELSAPLCNFTAKITEEVLIDDGENADMVFAIEGRLCNGHPLPRVEVPAGNFAGMGWVTAQWGIRASIHAGSSNKDHVRAALQELSGNVPRRTVYAYTGWRKIDGEWRYLHAGGALGASGNRADVEVNPGTGNMSLYRLPDPPEGHELADAIRATLALLDLAPSKPELGALLLAVIYRAPLAEVYPIDHAAFLVGYTGARKSEAAALVLAHFGDFTARTFPANWTDTPASLEVKAHAAKDAVWIVDDFKPHGSKGEIDSLHAKADKLIRGVGNQAGRGRLYADLKQRTAYHARGFVLSTGEDIPRGQSLRARMTVASLSRDPHDPRKGDIDLDRLTVLQGHARAGTLARAMAGYLAWLAPQLDSFKTTLPDSIRALRDKAAQNGLNGHSRAPADYASLSAGIGTLARFAVECGALTKADADAFERRCSEALWGLLEEQAEHQANQDDVTRFLALLASALSSGRCHVFDLEGSAKGCPTDQSGHSAPMLGWAMDPQGTWHAKGPRIGWLEGDILYLDGEATFTAVADYAREQGGNIEITQRTLFQRIYERGFLAKTTTEDGKLRLQIKKRIQGANPRVYALRLSVLI
jgi:hypothetical protein